MIVNLPDSIPSDGSREVSNDLNNWLASVADSASVVFPPDGVFWCDDTLELIGKTGFRIYGCGSRFVRRNQLAGFKNDVRARIHWLFSGCQDFAVYEVNVEGQANPPYGYDSSKEAQHGFSFLSCRDGELIESSVTDVWGDAINFACDASYTPTTGIEVYGFKSGCVLRDSVSLTFADNITLKGCEFGHSWRSGVDLEPNASFWKVSNILFDRCDWKSYRLNWVAAGNTNTPGVVTDVTFSSCSTRQIKVGVACDQTQGSRANFTVDSCVGRESVGGPNGAAIWIQDVDGFVTIKNNVCPLQAGRTPPMRVARFDDYTTANATITYEGNTQDLG